MNLGKKYNYFDHKLTYTNDGKLLDEYGHAIMMDWENDWMKWHKQMQMEWWPYQS